VAEQRARHSFERCGAASYLRNDVVQDLLVGRTVSNAYQFTRFRFSGKIIAPKHLNGAGPPGWFSVGNRRRNFTD
jgi:hypothetical protein